MAISNKNPLEKSAGQILTDALANPLGQTTTDVGIGYRAWANNWDILNGATAAKALDQRASQAQAAIGSAQSGVGAAHQGIEAVKGLAGQANATKVNLGNYESQISGVAGALGGTAAQIGRTADAMSQPIEQMSAAAGGMTPIIANIGTAAAGMQPIIANVGAAADAMGQDIANVRTTAQNLRPYADELQEYARTLWQQGINLGGQGQDLMAQGTSLMNLDANAGGLVGEVMKSLGMIDPNAYVSMGAADVQSSFNNAQQQMMRNLTRAGADASSLRTAAMQTQLASSMAAALSGAKTRLRVQGVKDRFAALGQATDIARGLINSGTETMNSALGYQTQASQNQANAGGLIAKMGELQATAGNLQARQGDLYGQQGQLQKGMGDLYGQQASAQAQQAKLYGDVAGARAQQASVYKSQADVQAQQAQAYNLAANLAQAGLNIDLNYADALVKAYGNETSAYKNLTAVQQAAADYYANEAKFAASASTSKNRGLALGFAAAS